MFYILLGLIVCVFFFGIYFKVKYSRYKIKEYQNIMMEVLALEYDIFLLRERYRSKKFITDDLFVLLWNGDMLDEDTNDDYIVVLYRIKRIGLKSLYKYIEQHKLNNQIKLHWRRQSLYSRFLAGKIFKKSKNLAVS